MMAYDNSAVHVATDHAREQVAARHLSGHAVTFLHKKPAISAYIRHFVCKASICMFFAAADSCLSTRFMNKVVSF